MIKKLPPPHQQTTIKFDNEPEMVIHSDGLIHANHALNAYIKQKSQDSKSQKLRSNIYSYLKFISIAILVLLFILSFDSYLLCGHYDKVKVLSTTGSPFLIEMGTIKKLKTGDEFIIKPETYISTENNSTLILKTCEDNLLIRQGTLFSAKPITYRDGTIRCFDIRKGAVFAQISPLNRDSIVQFRSKGAQIFVDNGLINISIIGKKTTISTNHSTSTIVIHDKKRYDLLEKKTFTVIDGEKGYDLHGVSSPLFDLMKRAEMTLLRWRPSPLRSRVVSIEENLILTGLENLRSISNLPTYLSDIKINISTKLALNEIALFIKTHKQENLSADTRGVEYLTSNSPLIQKRSNIFRDGKIHKLQFKENGNFEIFAYSKDSKNTLFIFRNGKVEQAKNIDIATSE